ncbi:ubiquitin-specific protease family C19 protein [Medicago truncatula]|uniref:Ubiquitin-specific protease family C19 protein n=1 Tax=Medicago truncatula TaxID=3880 RepID=A0A072UNS5_MEDTR|nr:ubiquitin-specific protease family C19 protein [Medicago truncatula]
MFGLLKPWWGQTGLKLQELSSKMRWSGCRGEENEMTDRHVVDFYISDFQSGLRALVKTGFGARVTPYVDDSVVIDVNPENKEMSPDFLRWLGKRNLSSDDRIMQLKEGYIKEGSTVSVMGVVHRNDNVLMIVPPPEPLTTGCQ